MAAVKSPPITLDNLRILHARCRSVFLSCHKLFEHKGPERLIKRLKAVLLQSWEHRWIDCSFEEAEAQLAYRCGGFTDLTRLERPRRQRRCWLGPIDGH
eukprot:3184535-Pleurochrysis_carterae.AAC.1